MRRTTHPPTKDKVVLCPKLGHLVSFSYCRSEQGDAPCHGIVACWYEVFLVEDYLRLALCPEEWEKFLRPPSGHKLFQLVELIRATRQIEQKKSLILQQPRNQHQPRV